MTFSQMIPAVGGLTNGGFVAAWQTNADSKGGSYAVHAQRYGSDGAKVGREFTVTKRDTAGPVRVAGLTDGGFVIAWIVDDGAHQKVYAKRYDADGAPIGRPLPVWSGPSRAGRIEAETVDLAAISGGFVVVWDAQPSGHYLTVYARIYATSAESTAPTRRIQVNTITSSHQYFPHIAAISGGRFAVAWSGDPSFSGSGVRHQIFSAAGKREGKEFSADTSEGTWSAIAPLSNGGFVIVYSAIISNSSEIAGQRFAADGSESGTEFIANTTPANSQDRPAVAGLDGGFVVVWQSRYQDGSGSGVYGRYLSN
jgi:hypothetical protein